MFKRFVTVLLFTLVYQLNPSVCTAQQLDWPLRIAVVSDPHVSSKVEDAVFAARLGAAVDAVNAEGVDAVLLPGDLTSHGFADALDGYRQITRRLDAPFYGIPGNHDVGNKPLPGKPSRLSDERVAEYERALGPSFYTADLAEDVRLIALNSALIGMGLARDDEQWAFLKRELDAAEGRRVVLMMHYPLFVNAEDEPGAYFNLDPEPRARLLNLIDQYEVMLVLTGHLHRPIEHTRGKTRYITAPAVSFGLPHDAEPEGWMLLTIEGDDITVEHHDLPLAKLNSEDRCKVHTFYYPWYGAPPIEKAFRHWNQGGHDPPQSLGTDYWPALGPYSSNDPAVLDKHMRWMREAGVGVVVTSWWGRDSFEDRVTPALLDAAAKHGLEVAFHLEPYPGSNPATLAVDARYLLDRYGDHPALHRVAEHNDRIPLYVFHSLKHSSEDWAEAIHGSQDGLPLRDQPLWLAQTTDLQAVVQGGFDGGYPYDILPWFRDFGQQELMMTECHARFVEAGKLFIPSLGPGYLDDRAVPNGAEEPPSARSRDNGTGETYRRAWGTVAALRSPWVSITSFNEWHEGSQIEPAEPRSEYYNYGENSSIYLHRTRRGVEVYIHAVRQTSAPHP